MRNGYFLIFIISFFIGLNQFQAQTISKEQATDTNNTEIDNKKTLRIHPNPSKDFIHVSSGAMHVESYEIFDILGAKVLQGTLNKDKRINIQNLINGVYFIRFNNGIARKVVKK